MASRAALGLCALAALLAAPARAEFSLPELRARVAGDRLELAGGFDLGLSAKVEEALSKGIGLEVVIELRLERHRTLLWNRTVGAWTLRRTIRYHALAGQYLVQTGPDSDVAESFGALAEALKFLGALDGVSLPLAEAPAGGDYRVRARAELDIEALPAPLRPVAYATPSWHLNSGWSTWKLAP